MMQNMQRDPAVFADVLSAMAEEELYEAMRDLETKSEELSRAGQDTSDVLARIAQVETEIEKTAKEQENEKTRDTFPRRCIRR